MNFCISVRVDRRVSISHVYVNVFLGLCGSIRCGIVYASISGGIELDSRLVSGKCCSAGLSAGLKHRKRTDAPDKADLALVIDMRIDLKRAWRRDSEPPYLVL